MDLPFLHFSTSLQVKRLAPKGTKMRMDHPFILDLCENVTLDIVCTISFSFFRKTNFLNLLSYLNHFVYLRFKYGKPQIIIIISNRTLISKLEHYPKGISIFYLLYGIHLALNLKRFQLCLVITIPAIL